jgi:hypothetical protein
MRAVVSDHNLVSHDGTLLRTRTMVNTKDAYQWTFNCRLLQSLSLRFLPYTSPQDKTAAFDQDYTGEHPSPKKHLFSAQETTSIPSTSKYNLA